jgi:hypothetical protein
MCTPSLAANCRWLSFACKRHFLRASERPQGSFSQGGGTTLMARSAKWQKGCRRVALRQFLVSWQQLHHQRRQEFPQGGVGWHGQVKLVLLVEIEPWGLFR